VLLALARAFHRRQETTASATARRTLYFRRSRIIYARRHLGVAGAAAATVAALAFEPLSRPGSAASRRSMSETEKALFGIEKLNVPRSGIPAVTHVDYSARIQTVHRETNPRYHALISAFKERTGCPVLVNTSFNVRGEPIVNTPEDAFRCFMGSEIEVLVVGNCFLRKEEQHPALKLDYKSRFDLD
jgi:carbamoyltransferase-like protein